MFKLVVVDLVGVLTKYTNIYSIFKKITKYKGTVSSLKAYLGDSYDNLITGKTTEATFWKKLISITKTRKKLTTIKKEFFLEFKPVFNTEYLQKAKEFFKFALCSDFYLPWYKKIKSETKIEFDLEYISSKEKKKKDKNTYLKLILDLKFKPNQCLIVSDEIETLKDAQSMEMQTLFIPGKTKTYSHSNYIYDTFNEFLQILY